MWTIPVEINYYFFIPILCLIVIVLDATRFKLFLACFLLLSCIHLHIDLTIYSPVNPFLFNIHPLKKWDTFPVFLIGSLLGFIYCFLEKQMENTLTYIRTSILIQFILNLITVSLVVYCFRTSELVNTRVYDIYYKGAFFWMCIIFLLLLSTNKYSYARRFFNNKLMCQCGMYSFGIYLWHPVAMQQAIHLDTYNIVKFNNAYETFFAIFLITYFIAFIFYILIEKNMIRFATFLCNKPIFQILKTNNSQNI